MERTLIRQRTRVILLRWLPMVLWMALIYWLSSQSSLPEPGEKVGLSDDLVNGSAHALAFAMLTLLAWRAFGARESFLPKGIVSSPGLSAGVFSALYGVSDEFHQWFVPGRDADIKDWLTDVAGIMLIIMLVRWWQVRRADG